MSDIEILQGKFDLNVHKKEFYNYLEVIIKPNGQIEYAVPSHQEKLKKVCIEKHGLEKFLKEIESDEAYYDYLKWLCNYSGCVSVWNEFCVKPDNFTKEQRNALKLLSEAYYEKGYKLKLYQGDL